MPINTSDLAKQYMLGSYTKWVKHFDVNDYRDNPPMIEKLYEEKQFALTETVELTSIRSKTKAELRKFEIENLELKFEVREVKRRSRIVFFLSLLATIFIGIGINMITTNPNDGLGWIFSISGCVLEIIAFFSK